MKIFGIGNLFFKAFIGTTVTAGKVVGAATVGTVAVSEKLSERNRKKSLKSDK